jgi:hypothetical protein
VQKASSFYQEGFLKMTAIYDHQHHLEAMNCWSSRPFYIQSIEIRAKSAKRLPIPAHILRTLPHHMILARKLCAFRKVNW